MQQLSDKQSVEASSSFTPHTHTLTADPRLHSDHTHFPTAHWMYPHTVTEVGSACGAVDETDM